MPHLVLVSTRIVTRRVPTVNVHFQIILMWILSTAAIDVANSSQGGCRPESPGREVQPKVAKKKSNIQLEVSNYFSCIVGFTALNT